ncbi:DUF2577 family protein [Listeria monocytogenes]|nr:DUF2577 family protein [Listeria monocytogenes]
MAGEELARRIKDAKPKESDLSDIVYGLVISTSPLIIRVDNQLDIEYKFLELSQMVKNMSATVWVDGKQGSVQIFRPLQVGDKVRMLRFSKGQKFYVLERS